MDPKLLAATLEAIRKAQGAPIADPRLPEMLAKSTFAQSASATSGLTFYDLELGAKLLYPVLTPLRNITPRVSGKGGIQAAWRAITAINTSGLRIGVSGGNRGGVIAVATADKTAAYKGIGLESNVDFEAQYAGQGFDDVRALAAKTGLESLMLGEETMILGGNNSLALGQTGTPTLSAGTAGALSDGTTSVICVALSLDGYINGSVTGGIQAQITRVNADGSSDTFGGGASQKSAAAAITLNAGTSTQSINCTVAAKKGAMGYAWFWGTAGSEVLGALTTINSCVITAAATGTQTAASLGTTDYSQNSLAFDGLLYQALATGSGAYVKTMATGTAGTGTKLTANGAGGVTEIDDMLQSMWDNYRLSPDTLWVNSQEQRAITNAVLTGSTTAAQRFVVNSVQDMLAGGFMVQQYYNQFNLAGAKVLAIKIHPNLPPGTILATTSNLPYPLANVANVWQIRTRQDYYQIEWPLRSRKYEYGVYADEVLQHYFPPSMGVITNIAKG